MKMIVVVEAASRIQGKRNLINMVRDTVDQDLLIEIVSIKDDLVQKTEKEVDLEEGMILKKDNLQSKMDKKLNLK
jgi:hypothetical protein